MGDSVRPTLMAIQKSTDGQTWVNWSYKVSSISQCQSRFQVQPSTAVTNLNGILCTTYTRAQLPRNEVVCIPQGVQVRVKEGRGRQSSFQVKPGTAVARLNGILCTTYTSTQLPRNEVVCIPPESGVRGGGEGVE